MFYCHPRTNGRRAIYGMNEPAPAIRTVNRPMPDGYRGHPKDSKCVERKSEGVTKMYDVTPRQPNNGLTVAEFFAGGGLMAVGFKTAGYNIVWANDFDPAQNAKKEQPQVTTYKHNIGDHIIQKDVMALTLDEIPDTDVIAGGPPCQDFSVAGL